MTKKERRLFFLERYVENFRAYNRTQGFEWATTVAGKPAIVTDMYICPLCLGAFKGHLALKEPFLTLEHNPPSHCGGKEVALTCKKCNNTFGHDSEYSLGKDFDDSLFYQKNPHVKLSVRTYVGESANMWTDIFHLPDGRLGMYLDERRNEHVFGKIHSVLKRESDEEVRFQFNFPKSNQANLACFKIAHLDAFTRFGYSYLLSANGKFILSALRKKEPPVPGYGLFTGVEEEIADGLYFAHVDTIYCFIVVFRLKTKKAVHPQAVLLPGFGPEALKDYLRFDTSISGHQVQLKRLKDFALPNATPAPNRYEHLWEEMKHWSRGPAAASL